MKRIICAFLVAGLLLLPDYTFCEDAKPSDMLSEIKRRIKQHIERAKSLRADFEVTESRRDQVIDQYTGKLILQGEKVYCYMKREQMGHRIFAYDGERSYKLKYDTRISKTEGEIYDGRIKDATLDQIVRSPLVWAYYLFGHPLSDYKKLEEIDKNSILVGFNQVFGLRLMKSEETLHKEELEIEAVHIEEPDELGYLPPVHLTLDSLHGYAIKKKVVRRATGKTRRETVLTDFISVAKYVWIPTRVVSKVIIRGENGKDNVCEGFSLEFSNVKVNEDIDPASFCINFPEGTKVWDVTTGITFTVGKPWEDIKIRGR